MKSVKPPERRKRSFNPDLFVTALSQAITRDLEHVKQEYNMIHPSLEAALDRQNTELLKKFEYSTVDQERLETEAFTKFRETNEYVSFMDQWYNYPWHLSHIQSMTPVEDKIHLRARALMHEVLGPLEEEDFFRHCKNSAGSSLGVPFADTSQERKFSFPLTSTVKAKIFFDRYLNWDFQLSEALDSFNAGTSFPKYLIEEGARATTVPKDSSKRRFISVEPTCNMFLQQGLMHLMYERMKSYGLDVASLPETHQKLARISSIVGNFATIDWSSASDSVGINLLRWLLPSKWFDVLNSVRSPCTHINGERVDLAMFSTMGNAGTFPLETLVFWTYAVATYQTIEQDSNTMYSDPRSDYRSECSVFGDDCIVPTHISELYVHVLELIGFQVNSEKSYMGDERFRESCGGDYLSGFPTRPVTIKAPTSVRTSSMEAWLYSIWNRVQSKYILYFGPLRYIYNRHAFHLICRTLREYNCKIKIVPPDFPDDAGIHGSDPDRLVLCYGKYGFSPIHRSQHGTYSFLYKRFVYRTHKKKSGDIRYPIWLKFPTITEYFDKPVKNRPDYSIRRIGGYVVARGFSAHWAGPSMETRPANSW